MSNGNHAKMVMGAVAFTGVGMLISVCLKLSAHVGDVAFVLLVLIFCGLGFLIAFLPRVESFKIGTAGLSATLARMEETRLEVERREKKVRNVSLTVAQMAVFIAAFGRRVCGTREIKLENAWLSRKARDILAEIEATPEEEKKVLRYVEGLLEVDALMKADETQAIAIWEAIWDRIEAEI